MQVVRYCRPTVFKVGTWWQILPNHTLSHFMKTVQRVSNGYGRTHRRTQRSCFYSCLLKMRRKFKINTVPLLHLCCISVTSCRLASHIKFTVNYSTWNHNAWTPSLGEFEYQRTVASCFCDDAYWRWVWRSYSDPQHLQRCRSLPIVPAQLNSLYKYTDSPLYFCSRIHSSLHQYRQFDFLNSNSETWTSVPGDPPDVRFETVQWNVRQQINQG